MSLSGVFARSRVLHAVKRNVPDQYKNWWKKVLPVEAEVRRRTVGVKREKKLTDRHTHSLLFVPDYATFSFERTEYSPAVDQDLSEKGRRPCSGLRMADWHVSLCVRHLCLYRCRG